jgi:hypothetical protein
MPPTSAPIPRKKFASAKPQVAVTLVQLKDAPRGCARMLYEYRVPGPSIVRIAASATGKRLFKLDGSEIAGTSVGRGLPYALSAGDDGELRPFAPPLVVYALPPGQPLTIRPGSADG